MNDPDASSLVAFNGVRARPEPFVAVAYRSHVFPSSRSNLYFVTPAAGEARGVMVLKNTLVSMKGVAPSLNHNFRVSFASLRGYIDPQNIHRE